MCIRDSFCPWNRSCPRLVGGGLANRPKRFNESDFESSNACRDVCITPRKQTSRRLRMTSASGQAPRFDLLTVTSGVFPTSDITGPSRQFRKGPRADFSSCGAKAQAWGRAGLPPVNRHPQGPTAGRKSATVAARACSSRAPPCRPCLTGGPDRPSPGARVAFQNEGRDNA